MVKTAFPRTAFVLGAGLGTRLRPLTDRLPKPLIPVFGKPLIVWAFDHLLSAGARELIVNTHHLPEAYAEEFPAGIHRGIPLTFRHEPVLLDTGGGIANIRDLIRTYPLTVYNGDILTDLPLRCLAQAHAASGADVTLALRSHGGPLRVVFEEMTGNVRGFGTGPVNGASPNRLFAGVYLVGPRLMDVLKPHTVESVIPAMERLLADGGRIHGVTLDEGFWFDLGSREGLIMAHNALVQSAGFPTETLSGVTRPRVHPTARVAPDARMDDQSVLAANVEIESGAAVERSLILEGAVVARGVTLSGCVLPPGVTATHSARDTIIG